MSFSLLRPMSDRRLQETPLYLYRVRQFLLAHPYCQVWLAEEGIPELQALREGGVAVLNGSRVAVPLSTQVHHRNKRRGADLLDQTYWLAVSSFYHREIEDHKDWARLRGYLLPF